MSQLLREWTADLLNELPDDGNRYEVIDGQLFVTPAPSDLHQRAIAELFLRLAPYAKSLNLDLLFAPVAIKFSPTREVQPDLLVRPSLPNGKFAKSFVEVGKLLLAAEVLSPYSRRTDREVKRDLYQNENVPDYWIVNTDDRVFECWQPHSENVVIINTTLLWQPLPSHPPLIIDVPEYFREAYNEWA